MVNLSLWKKCVFSFATFCCIFTVFGGSIFALTLSVASANSTITGLNANDFFGINGSYFGEVFSSNNRTLVLGASGAPETNKGIAYLFSDPTLGNSSISTLGLAAQIQGSVSNSKIGTYLSGGGDVDGDGNNDLAVGVPEKGKVYIFLGKHAANWSGTVTETSASLEVYTDTNKFNNAAESPSFFSISGDVNGDGYDDVLIGGDQAETTTNVGTGISYLIFGHSTLESTVSINLDSSAPDGVDVSFIGEEPNDHSGYSVAIVPDINGDGYDDLLISAYASGSSNIGKKVYLIYGERNGFGDKITANKTMSLSNASAIFHSKEGGTDGFGETVIGLRDINGDGYGDFAISAPQSSGGAGAVYIYYGGEGTPYSSTDSSSSSYSAVILGTSSSSRLGFHSVRPAGDVNGDLLGDFLIGSYSSASEVGIVYLYYGSETKLSGSQAVSGNLIINGEASSEKLGYSLGHAGDINADGIDEFFIGSPGFSSNKGKVALFSLATNATPNIFSGTPVFNFFSDPDFQVPITEAINRQRIYVQLVTDDPEPGTLNIVEAMLSSSTDSVPIRLRLKESTGTEGQFGGSFQLIRSRSSEAIRQLTATVSSTVQVAAINLPTSAKTLTVINSPPVVSNVTLTQTSSNGDTAVRIDYVLRDLDFQLCNVNSSSDLVQYLNPSSNTWVDATLIGSQSDLTSSEEGVSHNESVQPLYWNSFKDEYFFGDVQIRMKVNDGHDSSVSYAVSDLFSLDTTPPAAPVLSEPGTKYSYNITVTGSAEADSTILIYISNAVGGSRSLAATGNVNSAGEFSIFPIAVTETLNTITALAKDSANQLSVTSNEVTVTFGDTSETLSDGETSLTVTMPLGAVTTDAKVTVNSVAIADAAVSAPSPYDYVSLFDIGIEGFSSVDLIGQATIVVPLSSLDIPLSLVTVNYLDTSQSPPTWSAEGISDISISSTFKTFLTFKTTHFTQFMIGLVTSANPPTLSNPKIDGQAIADGSYVSNTPLITSIVSDQDANIASWSIQLLSMPDELAINSSSASLSKVTETLEIALNQLEVLPDGTYKIIATAWDTKNLSASVEATFEVLNSKFEFSALHAPNPFNPRSGPLTIGYRLSSAADSLQIYIVNLRGDILSTFNAGSTELTAGYHSFTWDGIGQGGTVPNGVYYAYCMAKQGSETKKIKLRIAVLK